VEVDCLCAGILFADHACSPVDHVPAPGELVVPERMQLLLGGCASNAGLDLAKLGVRVGVAGCVGEDVFGGFIIDSLVGGGVDVRGIHRVPDIGTASTMIINVRGQDRRFISTPGANTRFTVEHIPLDGARGARVLYVGGYLMLPGLETREMVELLRAVRAGGTIVVLDVVYVHGENFFDKVALLLPEVDVFLPNDDEAKLLTGLDDPLAQAERFRDAGARTVVITRGEAGTVLVGDGLRLRSGVYPTEFVGGTGSGDAFDAGYIAGLLAGEDPAGCLRWGSALGASCVRAIGATESVFNRDEAEAFMQEHTLEIETF
jgi:sugar/nucleoside kinase (ribokinase family)